MKATLKYLYIIPAILFLAAAFWAGWFWQEHLYRMHFKEGPPQTPGIVLDPGDATIKKNDLLVDEHKRITAQGEAELPVHRGEMGRQPDSAPPGVGLPTAPAAVILPSVPALQPATTPKPRLRQPVSPPPVTTPQPYSGISESQSDAPPRETGMNPKLRDDWPPLAQVVPVGPGPQKEFRGLLPGDSVKVPLTGEVKTEVINEKTGAIIAAKTNPISGTAFVTAEKDKLKVETEFDDTMRIGVTQPEPAVKRVHLGAALKLEERQTPALGGYLQYDIPLSQGKTFEWTVPLRVERWPDGWRGSVAVEVRF